MDSRRPQLGDNGLIGPVSAPAIHVMSYNIRYHRAGGTAPGEADHWPDRRPLLVELLGREQPGILGVQEALHDQLSALAEALPAHRMIGYGRLGGSAGEHNPLLIDADRFEVLAWDQRWLSDTPDVIGSTSWGNDIPRIVVWARLHDRATGRDLVAVNTHLDHATEAARVRGAEQLAGLVHSMFAGLPVLLTDDFNTTAQTPAHRTLLDAGMLDSWDAAEDRPSGSIASFADYAVPPPEGGRIDWILTSADWRTATAAVNPTLIGGRYASDHLPVHAVVTAHPAVTT